jgi:hypothetical protein
MLNPMHNPFMRAASLVVLALLSAACGKAESAQDESAAGLAVAEPASAVRSQPLGADPCAWLTRAEVERILGPLGAAPYRVNDAEQFDSPNPQGSACFYQLATHTEDEPAFVAVGVIVDGTATIEAGLGAGLSETGLDSLGGTDAGYTKRGGWDWKSDLGGAFKTARIGHLGIMSSIQGSRLSSEATDSLAAAIRDRIPDLPFGEPSVATGGVTGANPCDLVTQAEAEAVLGTLLVAPYRSREDSPIAYANGKSCSFYTAGHHVLVLTPTREDGKMIFGMMSGLTQNVSDRLGASAVDDTLDGPWDQTARGIDGALYVLKGDQLLAIQYRTSTTNLSGALRIAAAALPRL